MQRPSRVLWIAAIVVSVACVAALAYGLIAEWHTEPTSTTVAPRGGTGGTGFGLGLLIGIGTGIAIGSLIALRKRQP